MGQLTRNEVFTLAVQKYSDAVYRAAIHNSRCTADAEDVVQDCFVNVWENRHFEKLADGLDRYMFHLVKNAALNDLRGTQRRELRHEKVMAEMALENENGGEVELHEM